jgi:hypothetical protein
MGMAVKNEAQTENRSEKEKNGTADTPTPWILHAAACRMGMMGRAL